MQSTRRRSSQDKEVGCLIRSSGLIDRKVGKAVTVEILRSHAAINRQTDCGQGAIRDWIFGDSRELVAGRYGAALRRQTREIQFAGLVIDVAAIDKAGLIGGPSPSLFHQDDVFPAVIVEIVGDDVGNPACVKRVCHAVDTVYGLEHIRAVVIHNN